MYTSNSRFLQYIVVENGSHQTLHWKLTFLRI